MVASQYSISENALAVDALMLIRQHNLKILPVVDNGRLRGVLHRRDLSEAALCVSGSGDQCEMNYFCKKLKVKDLMVRMPITVSVDDTVEQTLIKGKQMMMSSFPVMDGDKVVGVVSDREIYITLFKLLEAGIERTRVTLKDVTLKKGTLSKILAIVDEAGAVARGIFTVPKDQPGKVRVLLRLEPENGQEVIAKLLEQGYEILEVS